MAVQRIEVITGAGGRRAYSAEEKIRLVGEAHGGRGALAAVARRHGVCSSLIYRWRRQMRSGELSLEAASFVPVHLVEASPPADRMALPVTPFLPPTPPIERHVPQIEVVLSNGRVLRVGEDIAPATLRRLADVLDGR